MWTLIAQSLYFFLPAFFANMTPEFFKWFPLNRPIHKKLLGKNKTWIGIITASLMGIVVFTVQKFLYQFDFFYNLSIIDYGDFTILFGFLLGAGAIGGDLVKSFFKRRKKIKPGASWKPWDQLDFAIGGLTLGFIVYVPKTSVAAIILASSFFLHLLICRFGYWLNIKNRPS